MSDSKYHHYLPQFYLKGFKIIPQRTKYAKIWLLNKSDEPDAKAVSIQDTGGERDYNTLDHDENNKDRQTIERLLSRIETEQAELLHKVIALGEVLGETKNDLAFFMSLMFHRVPTFKNHVESTLKGMVEATASHMLRRGDLPPPPPSIAQAIKEHGDNIFKADISNWKVLQYMYDAAVQSAFTPIIEKMNLSIVKAPSNYYFITSDAPVVLFDPNYHIKKPYGVGLADKDIQVSIAIDHKHLILASWDKKPSAHIATPDDILEYNRRVIVMGQRFLYSPFSDNIVFDLIQKYWTYNAGFDFSTLDYGEGSAHIGRLIPVTVKDITNKAAQ